MLRCFVFDLSSSNIKQENTISRITTDVPIIKQKTFIDKDKLSVELKKEQLTVKESETLLNEQLVISISNSIILKIFI